MTVNRITRTRRALAKGPSLWHKVTGLGMLATRAIRAADRRCSTVRRRDRAAHAMLTMDGTPEAKPSLYILDALNFLFRAFHALPPLTTTKGMQTGAIYGLCQMILRIEREQRPTHLCVVYDAPGENFRNAALRRVQGAPPADAARAGRAAGDGAPGGRGVRPDPARGRRASRPTTSSPRWPRWRAAAGMEVVICSSDKDLMQLCGDGDVAVLDTMKNRRIGPAEVQREVRRRRPSRSATCWR